jgi:phosphoglycerate kinase
MDKQTVRDVSFEGKKALVRVDFNVPIKDGKVGDDTRIQAALPTLKYILENGGSCILMSHLGRPDGQRVPEMSLAPVADYLRGLLDGPVDFADDCIGEGVRAKVQALQPGGILLLENVRFHKAETAKDDTCREFAKQLAEWGDLFVNDAFGSAHRPHASVSRVTEFLQPAVAGFLLEKEIEYLINATRNPERPFVAILGGAKVSDKIGVIKNLFPKVDALLIGGAMAYTLMASRGEEVGSSLVEEDHLDEASEILIDLEEAIHKDKAFLLPKDHVVAEKLEENAPCEVVTEIPDGKMGLDIGPESRAAFADWIGKAKTVIWNGPMGVFEKKPFDAGTMAVAKALADSDCVSIIGGGDSVSAIKKSGYADKVTHLSTGGGASLEVLEGKELPGLTCLTDRG